MSDEPEVYLKSAGPIAGGFEFQFQSSMVPIIAEHLAEQFKAMGGENYVGFEIDHVDLGPLMLTMQRRWGETPEKQAARYREALQWIVDYGAPKQIEDKARQALGTLGKDGSE